MNGLGQLEAAVMDVLWRAATPLRVREVMDRLAPQRTLAYTTVMTVLDNLHRKDWVVRHLEGKAYRYQPARSREEAGARAIRELLDATGDPAAVLLYFTRSASERELAALRQALRRRPGRR
jgi:predicted transcriptional regulator